MGNVLLKKQEANLGGKKFRAVFDDPERWLGPNSGDQARLRTCSREVRPTSNKLVFKLSRSQGRTSQLPSSMQVVGGRFGSDF